MSNIIDISLLNPVRFVNLGGVYKHFDDDWFTNLIYDFQDKVDYYQKWKSTDVIRLQFWANFTPIKVSVLDCSGKTIVSYNATAQPSNVVNPDFSPYEVNVSLTGLEGVHYLLLTAGTSTNETQLISEPMLISDTIDTILFKYKNSYNTQDVIFDTGIEFTFRCEAVLSEFTPGFKDTMYQDQILDNVMLNSIPFRQFSLMAGGEKGIPDWVVDKLNRVFSCDHWEADGKEFVKKDGTEWAPVRLENYPMSGWKIEVLEADTLSSKRGSNDGNPSQQIAVVYNVRTNLFGDFHDNADNNTVQITEIE